MRQYAQLSGAVFALLALWAFRVAAHAPAR
jgi:hypothetical protein